MTNHACQRTDSTSSNGIADEDLTSQPQEVSKNRRARSRNRRD